MKNTLLIWGICMLFVYNSCEDSFTNTAPIIEDQIFSIDENSPNGTSIGMVIATDKNTNQELSYTITSGNTNEAIRINSVTGELQINNVSAIDFETNPQFVLGVLVEDDFSQPLFTPATITINLNDIEITETISLQPSPTEGKDAQVWSGDPNGDLDRGTDRRDIVIYEWTFNGTPVKKYGLIDFDISFIVPDDDINEATVRLFHDEGSFDTGHSTLSGSNEMYLERIITNWEESLGWDARPMTTEDNRIIIPQSTSATQDYEISITQLLRDYKNNPTTSFGFQFKMVFEQEFRAVVFASSDHPNPEKRPELIINYTHE